MNPQYSALAPLLRQTLAAFALMATILAVNNARATACDTPTVLRFSMAPQNNAARDLAELQPLLTSLEATLGIPVQVVTPPSYDAVVEGLISGAVHLARLGPAGYVSARKQDADITPFASYHKKANAYQEAGAFYYALLIVRDDAPFSDIAALRGATLALVDPGSTSGSLVPRRVFSKVIERPLERYFSRILYTGSHAQSAQKVAEGQLDAAFVGSSNLATYLLTTPNPNLSPFRILWRSQPIPLDPFVYRGQLCADIVKKIRIAFFGKDGKQNQALLDNLHATRFVPVTDADYDIVRSMQ